MYEYQEKSCIACGKPLEKIHSAKLAKFVSKRVLGCDYEFPIRAHFCNGEGGCQTMFTYDRFTDEEMSRLYSGYNEEEYITQRIQVEPDYKYRLEYDKSDECFEFRSLLIDHIIKNVTEFDLASIHSILDWGGDDGTYIAKKFEKQKKYLYDISERETVDGVKLWDGKTTVDMVVIKQVLEHVSDPNQMIQDCKSALNDGGWIYLEVPVSDNPPLPNGIFHEHINCFTNTGFYRMVERNGINIVWQKLARINLENATFFYYGILGQV